MLCDLEGKLPKSSAFIISLVEGSQGMSKANQDDDDWDTDPSFENSLTEKEQRYGAARNEGTAVHMSALREEVKAAQEDKSKAK